MDERAMPGDLEHPFEHMFEHMFEHQEWVRALAVRLSGGGTAADDLVQDTWVEAMQVRRVPESPRAWIGGIVRNLARSSRRRDGARSERERRAASGEALPSAVELLERAELQRRVLAAVASLDEPYRVVVLLRYAERLDSERIATRLGVPGSTVRNRLARALERLRAKLDGEYGDRGNWALLFVPTFSDAAVKTLVVGGGVVKAQIAIAAALVVAATVLWWPKDPRSSEITVSSGTAAVEIVHATPTSPAADDDGERALDEGSTRSVAARVERVLLTGRVIGPTAEEARSATFRVVGTDGVARTFTTGVDGVYSVFGLPPGLAHASASLAGFVPFSADFEVGADNARMQRDFVLQRAFVVPVRFTNLEGRPLELPNGVMSMLSVVATRDRPSTLQGVEGRCPWVYGAGLWRPRDDVRFDSGPSEKSAGVLEVREPTPLWTSAVLRELVLESRILHGSEGEVVFGLDSAVVLAQLGSVTVRLVDGRTGEPLANAGVNLDYRDATEPFVTADESGRVTIEGVVPGLREFRALARDRASVSWSVRVVPGEQLDLGEVRLFPSVSVRGRVLDPSGRGVAAQVDVIPERFAQRARALDTKRIAQAAADGEFSFGLAEAGPILLVVRHRDWALAVVHGDVQTDARLEVHLVAGTPVELRSGAQGDGERWYEVRDAHGDPVAFGRIFAPYPVRSRLAPGTYVLHVGSENSVLRSESFSVASNPVILDLSTP